MDLHLVWVIKDLSYPRMLTRFLHANQSDMLWSSHSLRGNKRGFASLCIIGQIDRRA